MIVTGQTPTGDLIPNVWDKFLKTDTVVVADNDSETITLIDPIRVLEQPPQYLYLEARCRETDTEFTFYLSSPDTYTVTLEIDSALPTGVSSGNHIIQQTIGFPGTGFQITIANANETEINVDIFYAYGR